VSRQDVAYARAALLKAAARIRSTPEGSRAKVAYNEAYGIGRLLRFLDPAAAEEALLDAAIAAGLEQCEACANVQSGLARGSWRPKDPAGAARPLAPLRARERGYPPCAEVLALWERATPASEDDEAAAWITSRGLDPRAVELWDLARALPADGLPAWATTWQVAHRLVVPLLDATGTVRSLCGRAVRQARAKQLFARGFDVRGLLMACPLARTVLAAGAPEWWQPSFVIAEGWPDFLTWAARQRDASEDGPAVFGVFSGSWTREHGARLPAGSRVVVRTHRDDTGEGYARGILGTLAHCETLRAKGEQHGRTRR